MVEEAETTSGQKRAFTFAEATTTSSPFAQSTFGKPATVDGFGQTPAFGQEIFGSTQSAPAEPFGTSSSGFGTTQPAFGGFSETPQTNSLFGANMTTEFRQTQPNTSYCNVTSKSSKTRTRRRGRSRQTKHSDELFQSGTALVSYQPPVGTDTLTINGQTATVNTKYHCITAMKEYESKSLEELRLEHYMANRKGSQPVTGSLFGSNTAVGGGLFGIGSSAFGAPTNASNKGGTALAKYQPFMDTDELTKNGQITIVDTTLHCITAMWEYESKSLEELHLEDYVANRKGSEPVTGSLFGSNTAQPPTGLFGAHPENKGVFGSTTNSLGSTGFGQPAASPFGATNQAPTFGQTTTDNKAPFGLGTSTVSIGFGAGFGTNTTGGGLFGAKPTTEFGTGAFGTNTPTATRFGGFGTKSTSGGSFFNTVFNKPAPAFGGFNTQTSTTPLGTTGRFNFGNKANKPGDIFGTNQTQAADTSLFGNTSNFNVGLVGSSTNTLGNTMPIQRNIITLASVRCGDNPIFHSFKLLDEKKTEAVNQKNPAAQKAILEFTIQLEVSSKVNTIEETTLNLNANANNPPLDNDRSRLPDSISTNSSINDTNNTENDMQVVNGNLFQEESFVEKAPDITRIIGSALKTNVENRMSDNAVLDNTASVSAPNRDDFSNYVYYNAVFSLIIYVFINFIIS